MSYRLLRRGLDTSKLAALRIVFVSNCQTYLSQIAKHFCLKLSTVFVGELLCVEEKYRVIGLKVGA